MEVSARNYQQDNILFLRISHFPYWEILCELQMYVTLIRDKFNCVFCSYGNTKWIMCPYMKIPSKSFDHMWKYQLNYVPIYGNTKQIIYSYMEIPSGSFASTWKYQVDHLPVHGNTKWIICQYMEIPSESFAHTNNFMLVYKLKST